jgi:chromosome segregation ATPase
MDALNQAQIAQVASRLMELEEAFHRLSKSDTDRDRAFQEVQQQLGETNSQVLEILQCNQRWEAHLDQRIQNTEAALGQSLANLRSWMEQSMAISNNFVGLETRLRTLMESSAVNLAARLEPRLKKLEGEQFALKSSQESLSRAVNQLQETCKGLEQRLAAVQLTLQPFHQLATQAISSAASLKELNQLLKDVHGSLEQLRKHSALLQQQHKFFARAS